MPFRRAADLVASFDFPRDTTASLQAASDTLVAALRAADLTPRLLQVHAHPHRAEMAALCWVAAATLFGAAAWRRRRARRDGRRGRGSASLVWAAGVGIGLGIAAFAGGLDWCLPTRASVQIEVVVEPVRPVARELLLGAHYDSKTEPFDHVGRAVAFVVAGCALLVAVVMRRVGGASRAVTGHARAAAAAATAAAACALAAFAAGGARVGGDRSHGIADDAASVVLLIELAAEARLSPPESTRLRCVWWCDEEIGAQGSRAWVRRTALDSVPRTAINLECIGAGPRLAYAAREWAAVRWYDVSQAWVDAVQGAAGSALAPIALPVVTDAGNLRRAGIDAGTLIGVRADGGAPRGLHRPSDRLAALDERGVDAAGALLRRLLASP